MPKLIGLPRVGWVRKPSPCVMCGKSFVGTGYFCSSACDLDERFSRIADRLTRGLRMAVRRRYEVRA